MIFLVEYIPRELRTVMCRRFDDGDRQQARDERLELELDLNRRGLLIRNGGNNIHEVNIFEASSEDAFRRNHGRYFPLPAA